MSYEYLFELFTRYADTPLALILLWLWKRRQRRNLESEIESLEESVSFWRELFLTSQERAVSEAEARADRMQARAQKAEDLERRYHRSISEEK